MVRVRQTLFATSMLLVGTLASATPKAAPTERELEITVWTADESRIPALEREVTHLMQVNARSVTAHHLLSHVFVRMFTRDPSDIYLLRQAADLAQQAVDLAPNNPAGYSALADILDLMGNTSAALKLLTSAESRGVKPNWRFAFTRARLLADSGSSDKVLALLRQSLSYPDSQPDIVVPYVVAILQSDFSGDKLVANLDTWNQKFPSQLFDLTTAITYSEMGEALKAHKIYNAMLAKNPNNTEARINNAILLYRDLNQSKKAAAQLEGVLNGTAYDLMPSLRATVVGHLGVAYVNQKDWTRAHATFMKAVDLETEHNEHLTDFISRAYKNANAHAKLAALLKDLSEHVSGQSSLYAMLGETLSANLNKHDDAIKSYTDAIVLDPNRADYYTGMGLALYRKKSYAAALKVFVTASELDPNDAIPRYNQACVLALLGRKDESIQSLAEAIALDPRLAANARNDRDFVSIAGSVKFRNVIDAAGELPTSNIEVAH